MTEFFNPWKAQKPDDSFWKLTNERANSGAYQQRRQAMTDKKDTSETKKLPFDGSQPNKLPPVAQDKPAAPPAFPFLPR